MSLRGGKLQKTFFSTAHMLSITHVVNLRLFYEFNKCQMTFSKDKYHVYK